MTPISDGESEPNPSTEAAKVTAYLADPRLRVCLEATAEVAILLGMVLQRIKASDARVLKMETQVLLVRCLRLCSLMQDGLGDETVSTECMQAVLQMEEGS